MIRLAAFILLCLAAALPARAFDTRAGAAWVYDLTTDTVLLEKNANEKLPPASMSKLMTVNMLFEALRAGRVRLDDRFPVSAHAKSMQGSTMFLNENDRPTVEELIKGIIVLSGNDACVVVAEGLAGTEEEFAKKMNERARAIGMNDSTFANASGWPHPNQRMSMHDLGILAVRLIREFPEYYGYFSIREFPYDGRAPDNRFNRNPVLALGIGADGLKTGHTEESGFGLVGSAVQNGRRIVFVLTGLASAQERSQEAERVANWAFREFAQKTVAVKGTRVAEADVWLGSVSRVGLVVKDDLSLLVPSSVHDKLRAEVRFSAPLLAPLAEGQEVGEMVVDVPGMPAMTVPVVTEAAVAKGGFAIRLRAALGILTKRLMAEIGS
ncbi:MAG: D-alanyl-D-alanine carboxypeptidase [Defluviimonas sp.]|uniref:D-alanyl-D-alanine carboxypeptidase family protein n=1 Tax=Albidovulum sp. TaxID=1872424 RepID=UPI001DE20A73|nr:D-alanyl-D-alanine carboxypeptidase [Paracoccaceae bacterium]MCC0063051.1 D-alanyl-D-alanine carboxypeptidase [Defluviimonas sp.]